MRTERTQQGPRHLVVAVGLGIALHLDQGVDLMRRIALIATLISLSGCFGHPYGSQQQQQPVQHTLYHQCALIDVGERELLKEGYSLFATQKDNNGNDWMRWHRREHDARWADDINTIVVDDSLCIANAVWG
jgi:hypothetical protein